MKKVILYIATSLDGYIARTNGDIDWLTKYEQTEEDYGYDSFYQHIGTLIMGRRTYEQVLTFGAWPYKGKKTIVISSQTFENKPEENIEFYSGDLTDLVKRLKKESDKDIWLVGGATMVSSFMKADLLDDLIVTVMPILLGEGISLFKDIKKEMDMDLQTAEQFPNGVIQLRYAYPLNLEDE